VGLLPNLLLPLAQLLVRLLLLLLARLPAGLAQAGAGWWPGRYCCRRCHY
jgi:hypothetical protein